MPAQLLPATLKAVWSVRFLFQALVGLCQRPWPWQEEKYWSRIHFKFAAIWDLLQFFFRTREASELRLRLKSKLSLRTTRGVGGLAAAKGGAASADFAVAAAVVDKQVEEAIVSKRMRARKRWRRRRLEAPLLFRRTSGTACSSRTGNLLRRLHICHYSQLRSFFRTTPLSPLPPLFGFNFTFSAVEFQFSWYPLLSKLLKFEFVTITILRTSYETWQENG